MCPFTGILNEVIYAYKYTYFKFLFYLPCPLYCNLHVVLNIIVKSLKNEMKMCVNISVLSSRNTFYKNKFLSKAKFRHIS